MKLTTMRPVFPPTGGRESERRDRKTTSPKHRNEWGETGRKEQKRTKKTKRTAVRV